MTTFHELLGTSAEDSTETIKQRYKQLSIRLHPDKGGSKALMQLLSLAYQFVLEGKGHFSFSSQQDFQDVKVVALQNELAQIRGRCDALKSQNQQLENRLKQSETRSSASRFDKTKKVARLSAQVALLKENTQTLERKLNQALHDKSVLSKTIKASHLSQESIQHLPLEDKISFKQSFQQSLKLLPPIMLYSVFTAVCIHLLHLQMRPASIVVMDGHSHDNPMPAPNPDLLAKAHQVSTTRDVETTEPHKHNDDSYLMEHFLQPMNDSGQWRLSTYKDLDEPYIAIKSLAGSYVVNDCTGDFMLYLHQTEKPLRVAANLIFQHSIDDYHIYAIPYGLGSSYDSWFGSKKIKLGNQYFTSKHFDMSYDKLQRACQLYQTQLTSDHATQNT